MTAPRENNLREITAGPASVGQRLDRMLADGLSDLSRSRVKALVEAGRVTAGGVTITDPSYRVKPGQTFAIMLPDPVAALPAGQAIALDVVYEDADLIVINKPAGMVVHPAPGNPDETLVNALIAHCGSSLSGIGGVRRPGIVHRLDKDTSGLLVAAKNDVAHQALADAFARHDVERAYWAVVWGIPAPRAGEIAGAIGRHPVNRKKMAVVSRGGKAALTRYRVLRPLGPAVSLVECRLATGRTHQIRVHLASIGHPLIGDPVYGRTTAARLGRLAPAARAAVEGMKRQALHAFLLGFRHPRTGLPLRWEAEMPADILGLTRSLEQI
ncbi:RluA family pseudouridine synthase [Rhodospirillaceae bacterium SYSU D60014]|uniref:RluA family pseudouridine synthase n=1 Tax=Virgifigura deserti TaxID=2268457 RepID=UPI000E67520F